MRYNDTFLHKKLDQRIAENALRRLTISNEKVDLCSNDYLGIVKNDLLHQKVSEHSYRSGSTGSRSLTGNYEFIETTEKKIASFHQSEAALIFNSGYDANIGVLSSVPQKDDTILYDQLSHASIRDGIRLSFASSYSFLHNDLDDLERKMQQAKGNIFIVTESVFSMDGDLCPLEKMVMLAERYQAHLIIDEAHATGVIGPAGEGLVQELQLQEKIFCRIHTFGKAVGCHGAVVLGSALLCSYLINFARSFMYTTALPEHAIATISTAYDIFPGLNKERDHLNELVMQFRSASLRYEKIDALTPIQGVIVPGNDAVKEMARVIQEEGMDVRPILYPTVPKGKERLRIVLHSFNSSEELSALLSILS